MSATTPAVSSTAHGTHAGVGAATFAGNLKSEWIKLTTVRSTIWSLIILTVVTLGLAALIGSTDEGVGRSSYELIRSVTTTNAFGSISLTCLVVAVLGVLFSAGEYGTGSIRSTMTATPRRLPVFWAKIGVLGLTTFAFAFVVLIASVAIVSNFYAQHGGLGATDPGSILLDPVVIGVACAAAGYLALTATFALAIGFVVRSVSAAISIVVGLLFVIPIIVEILGEKIRWLADVSVYQFAAAGRFMRSIPISGPSSHEQGGTLEPWQGTLVVLAWVAVTTVIAAVLVKNKDA